MSNEILSVGIPELPLDRPRPAAPVRMDSGADSFGAVLDQVREQRAYDERVAARAAQADRANAADRAARADDGGRDDAGAAKDPAGIREPSARADAETSDQGDGEETADRDAAAVTDTAAVMQPEIAAVAAIVAAAAAAAGSITPETDADTMVAATGGIAAVIGETDDSFAALVGGAGLARQLLAAQALAVDSAAGRALEGASQDAIQSLATASPSSVPTLAGAQGGLATASSDLLSAIAATRATDNDAAAQVASNTARAQLAGDLLALARLDAGAMASGAAAEAALLATPGAAASAAMADGNGVVVPGAALLESGAARPADARISWKPASAAVDDAAPVADVAADAGAVVDGNTPYGVIAAVDPDAVVAAEAVSDAREADRVEDEAVEAVAAVRDASTANGAGPSASVAASLAAQGMVSAVSAAASLAGGAGPASGVVDFGNVTAATGAGVDGKPASVDGIAAWTPDATPVASPAGSKQAPNAGFAAAMADASVGSAASLSAPAAATAIAGSAAAEPVRAASTAAIDPQASAAGVDASSGPLAAPVPAQGQPSVFASVQQAAESPEATPVTAQQLPAAIDRGAAELAKLRGGTLTIEMTPAELGRVRLEMRVDDGGRAVVEIVVADSTVKPLVDQAVGGLRDALSREGLDLASFNVSSGANYQNQQETGKNPGFAESFADGASARKSESSSQDAFRAASATPGGRTRPDRTSGSLSVFA